MAPNATQEKTERLLNLVVYLLGHKQGVTRATIRASMK
jgi:predicted DNA-binding transcriptional regulator YafY